MRRTALSVVALLLVGALAVAVGAQDHAGKTSTIQSSPEWQKLKTLVGTWEGTMEEGGQKMPATAEVRLTGDGSALMHVLGPGSPYEMVTMFHPDGKRLLATHYCAAHNQPRMALVPSKSANEVMFDFIDGTNIASGDTHMKSVAITFVDADHHQERWASTGASGGAALFTFARKK
jgi:hypothetical protein